jgi:GT2 family glycosyltransferase
MIVNKSLSWGLVVATYQREKVLPLCLKLAIEQTRKPTEIIIIDASDNWESTRDTVMAEIASKSSDIRWVYTCAEHRSSTLQRNQGLQLATADVVFLFDDDSLMYPTCAEEIMRIYEADTEGVVKGVQADSVDHPPSELVTSDSKKQTGWSEKWFSYGIISFFQRLIWKHLFLMDAGLLFLPYDGDFPKHEIPASVEKLNVHPVQLLQGYRMTFRRDAILKEIFEPLLRYYAAGEDLDASYRVSRHGPLLVALDAKVHHFQSASGRLPRFKVSVLSALNQALCLRKHSSDLNRNRQLFYRLMARRVLAETLKDALSRRWDLPQARGILVALKYSSKLFTLPDEELAEWYPFFQHEFLVSDSLID